MQNVEISIEKGKFNELSAICYQFGIELDLKLMKLEAKHIQNGKFDWNQREFSRILNRNLMFITFINSLNVWKVLGR